MENFPLTCNDVKGVDNILGDNLRFLAGKTPRKSTPHSREKIIPIPATILQCYRNVTLEGYVMYVNGIHFINIISRHIKFMTDKHIAKT